MLKGSITLADMRIEFLVNEDTHTAKYSIYEYQPDGSVVQEDMEAPQDKFLKALAIAVHNDGMPDAEKDYPDAESIQGKIRWIP